MNTNINPPQTPTPMSGVGKLIFRVSTASGAIPLAGAKVVIRQRGDTPNTGNGNALMVLTSDRDGKTPMAELPTPPRSLSLTPTPNDPTPPFACYDAEVTLDGFYALEFVCIPVFDGITSIQPATLTPLPENGRADGVTPEDTTIIEGENPNL